MEAVVAVVAWDCSAEAVAALAALQILRLVHMAGAEVVA
jgi:predicted phosphatase